MFVIWSLKCGHRFFVYLLPWEGSIYFLVHDGIPRIYSLSSSTIRNEFLLCINDVLFIVLLLWPKLSETDRIWITRRPELQSSTLPLSSVFYLLELLIITFHICFDFLEAKRNERIKRRKRRRKEKIHVFIYGCGYVQVVIFPKLKWTDYFNSSSCIHSDIIIKMLKYIVLH